MFRRYVFKWSADHEAHFYVYRKPRKKGGFVYLAAATGYIPRLDEYSPDVAKYTRNTKKLEKARSCRLIWDTKFLFMGESWQGQTVLKKLWEQLAALPFTDMQAIHAGNPFEAEQPDFAALIEPKDIFG